MDIGIDIGTHVARAAFIRNDGLPQLVTFAHGASAMPALARQTMHELLIGEAAAQSLVGNAETTLIGCTRLMGRAGNIPPKLLERLPYHVRDIGGEMACNLLYAEVRASEVFGLLVRELADAAKRMTGQSIDGVSLTVPAGAEDRFRVQARAAVEAQGLQVRRLINQPTAAILGIAAPLAGNVAIISCSGATTEVSLAEIQPSSQLHSPFVGGIRILATATDPLLGGDDIAWGVAERLNIHFTTHMHCDVFAADESRSAALGLRRAAEDLLWELRTNDQALLMLDHGGGFGRDLSVVVRRTSTLSWLKPWFTRIAALCRKALHSAGLQAHQIEHIVLIGDWAALPGLDRTIATVFGRQVNELHHSDDATALAAFGAARAASTAVLNIWDVTPYPLGINCYYGNNELLSPIIRANTPIPTPNASMPGAFTERYTTRLPGQTSVTLDVLQYRGARNADPYGTEPVPPDACEKLGSWQFGGLHPAAGHCADFTVTFSIDQDGILHLRACETATGHTLEGHIKRGVG